MSRESIALIWLAVGLGVIGPLALPLVGLGYAIMSIAGRNTP